ncbi:protein bric-a-brac 2 isoform X6 [Procambarus clarkii]|uniref:protein bric-a-brac 2 isoform X6 n=1 Tax=Procambarus clarkii TaxID=6728 RepID=UPI001E67376B|nr:protein bric-a-brac 2-like isoform X6 [Procambarus clarkii]
MDGGLLSLRWNDHGQTFFKMLSGVRKREAYCDVTLACDGRFYPVHKLVLSTCSDFFDQMFEKTACKHPVIVVANVAYKDLEALLNYMYLGEVNVLQTELTGLMKAAEALRIKGLAEPSKGPSSRDFRENKRSSSRDGDLTDSKRKRTEETQNISRQNQLPASESDRMVNSRETQKSKVTNNDSRAPVVKAQGPSSCGSNSSNSTDHPGASSSTEPLGNSTKQDLGASSQSDAENDPTDKALRPEVKMEEVLVKEEPSGWFPETEEGLESLQFSEADTSLGYTHQPTTFRGGCLPWDLAAAATQAHVLDSQLSQGIPGPSRMQGIPQLNSGATTDHLKIGTSRRKDKQLYVAGFAYIKNRIPGTSGYWRCTDRICPGRLVLLGNEVVKAGKHNHPPSPDGWTTANVTLSPSVDL